MWIRLWKISQSPINRHIWSHCLFVLSVFVFYNSKSVDHLRPRDRYWSNWSSFFIRKKKIIKMSDPRLKKLKIQTGKLAVHVFNRCLTIGLTNLWVQFWRTTRPFTYVGVWIFKDWSDISIVAPPFTDKHIPINQTYRNCITQINNYKAGFDLISSDNLERLVTRA